MLRAILLLAMLQGYQVPSEDFVATAYAETGYRTATMVYPQEGVTVAVDPRVIPLHSIVWIEGKGLRIAQDTGGFIKGRRLDVYITSEAECREFGRRTVKTIILLKAN